MLKLTGLNRSLRWLLQVDQPVPARLEAEISAEVEKNYPWNLAVNVLDVANFWFGLSFVSSTTIVPLFVSKLTDSTLAIGLVAMIAQGAWFLPQLFTANVVERLARKKPVVVNLGFFSERLPMWLLVVAALLAKRSATVALLLFFVGYLWHGLGAGVVATAWQDLLARCFPVARRGRAFGMMMFVGTGIGAVGASMSAWLLRRFPFPTNFAYSFLIAAIFITLSVVFLALTREPVQPVTTPRRSNQQFWADLPKILQRDVNFQRFLVARLLLALTGMGTGFLAVAAVRQWGVADSTVGLYTAVNLIGQTIGNLAFGLLADKYGHKLSLEISGLAVMLAFFLAWLANAPVFYFAVFALLGVYTGAIIVSGIMVVLEFPAPEKRPTYAGLANTGVGLVSALAPLLGAGLAAVGYNWLFVMSGFSGLLGFVLMRWWVQEPRFVTGN
jgi:MFS family permease